MGGREEEKTLTKTFFSVVSAQPTAAGCSGVSRCYWYCHFLSNLCKCSAQSLVDLFGVQEDHIDVEISACLWEMSYF